MQGDGAAAAAVSLAAAPLLTFPARSSSSSSFFAAAAACGTCEPEGPTPNSLDEHPPATGDRNGVLPHNPTRRDVVHHRQHPFADQERVEDLGDDDVGPGRQEELLVPFLLPLLLLPATSVDLEVL